ncbi:Tas1r1, partial [Symbiodinium sp. CCMP2456]
MGLEVQKKYRIDKMRFGIDNETIASTLAIDVNDISQYSPFSFDAVYAFIVAINGLLHKGLSVAEIKGKVLLDELQASNFSGISGDVEFDEKGDRLTQYNLLNIQQNGNSTEMVLVAVFSASTRSFAFKQMPVWMDGNRSEEPIHLFDCDPGFYQEDDSKLCRKCPRGMQCAGGLDTFQPCRPGTFANATGMQQCMPCPQGSFAPDAGSAQCSACRPGSEAPET